MDIEAIVKKQVERYFADLDYEVSDAMRAALTELAAGYEGELTRLREEMHLTDEIRLKMGRLLDGVAVVLKGEPPELVQHSWHDLPELCKQRIAQLEAERVPDGVTTVPTEILDRFPELNMSNYGHDDVAELNAWGVELVLAAAPAKEGK